MIERDKVLLTDKQIMDAVISVVLGPRDNDRRDKRRAVAKAQAKKLLGLLDERCHHGIPKMQRFECHICMAEIREVVDGR